MTRINKQQTEAVAWLRGRWDAGKRVNLNEQPARLMVGFVLGAIERLLATEVATSEPAASTGEGQE